MTGRSAYSRGVPFLGWIGRAWRFVRAMVTRLFGGAANALSVAASAGLLVAAGLLVWVLVLGVNLAQDAAEMVTAGSSFIAALAAWLSMRVAKRSADRAEDRTGDRAEGQVEVSGRRHWAGVRFSEAIAQLGHEKAEVRLGGLYALEALAKEALANKDSHHYQAVINMACGYLRIPYTPPTGPVGDPALVELEVRLTTQRLISSLLRSPDDGREPHDETRFICSIDLRGAWLKDFDLRYVAVGAADFRDARFDGEAAFHGVRFIGDARFDRTQFAGGALFNSARFIRRAGFDHVQFAREATFDAEQFDGKALFHDALFSRAASFNDAQFRSSAVFLGARFRAGTSFHWARVHNPNGQHVLPDGWRLDGEGSLERVRTRRPPDNLSR
ncbi:MAG: hypothetical protein GEV11_24305 [Streptosporangiales bacterium]|nr:hypothetical protein [Streptosporangiales bacterium]